MIKKFFRTITDLIDGTEESFVDLICAVSPWLTTVVPASMTYVHTTTILKFPVWLGLISAIAVETVGFAAVKLTASFIQHNKQYTSDTKRAPLFSTIGIYVFYLFIILTVNVALEWSSGVNPVNILAIGLLSLLSFPGAVLVAVRAQHSELLRNIAEQKEQRLWEFPKGTLVTP